MFSEIPNLTLTFGYINASWTLRVDLVADYACRILNHMDKVGARKCVPLLREEDLTMTARPWIENFSSGYVQRALHLLPKQGDRAPWSNPQNYFEEKESFRKNVDDGVLNFSLK
jgi:monooxygenase